MCSSDLRARQRPPLVCHARVNARPPAEADMQRYFRVSPPSVHQMMLTLERTGLIRRQPGQARSIQVLVDTEHLPVLRPAQHVRSSVLGNYGLDDSLQLPILADEGLSIRNPERSEEERRVGKEWVRTCRSRLYPYT